MARGKTRKVVRSNKGKSTAPVRAKSSGSKPRLKSQQASPKNKATLAEVELRIHQVYQWILEAVPSHEIVRRAAEQWGVASRQAQTYIGRASEMVKEEAAKRAETSLEDHLTVRWFVYNRAIETGDNKTASMVLKDIARLQALYATDRSMLAKAGLDDALKDSLASADSAAADILRQAYQPGDSKDD